MNSEKGPRACQLSVKLAHRIKQHVYAEPKYLVNLMYSLYEESILLAKIVSIIVVDKWKCQTISP